MEKYNQILAASPVPLYIMHSKEFILRFFINLKLISENTNIDIDVVKNIDVKRDSVIFILGMYVSNHSRERWPEEFIFINKILSPEQIVSVFFHETGHYYCKKNRCECMTENNTVLKETHVMLNELEKGWEYNVPKVLEMSFRIMTTYALYKNEENNLNLVYKKAVMKITEYDIWKRTVEYLTKLEKEDRL